MAAKKGIFLYSEEKKGWALPKTGKFAQSFPNIKPSCSKFKQNSFV